MKRAFLVYYITLFFQLVCYSQLVIIKGKILNEHKDPIAFGSVQLLNTNFGCVSNRNGDFNFKINNPKTTDSLQFACLGYKSKALSISKLDINSKNIITLQSNIIELNEIAVKPLDGLYLIKEAVNEINKNYIDKPYIEQIFYRELLKEDESYIGIGEAIADIQNFPGVYPIKDNIRNYMKFENSSDYLKFGNNFIGLFWNGNIISNNKNYINLLSVRSNNYFHKSHLKPIITGSIEGLKTANWVFNPTIFGFLIPDRFDRYKYTYKGVSKYFDRNVYKILVEPKIPDKTQFEGTIFIDCEQKAIVYLQYNQNPQYQLRKGIIIRNPSLFTEPQEYGENFMDYKSMFTEVFFKPIRNKWTISHIKRSGKATLHFSKDYLLKKGQNIDYEFQQILQVTNILEDTISPKNDTLNDYNSTQTLSLTNSNYSKQKELWESFNQINPTHLEDSIKRDLEKRKSLYVQYVENSTFIDDMAVPEAQIVPHKIDTEARTLFDNYFWMQNLADSTVSNYINAENEYTNNIISKNKVLFKTLLQEVFMRRHIDQNKQSSFSDTIVLKDRFNPSRANFYYVDEKNGDIAIKRKCKKAHSELLLDYKDHSELQGYYPVYIASSPSNKYIAILFSDVSENLSFKILNLETNKLFNIKAINVDGIMWNRKEDLLYYSTNKDSYPALYSYNLTNKKFHSLIKGDRFDAIDYHLSNNSLIIEHRKRDSMSVYMYQKYKLSEILPMSKHVNYFMQTDGSSYYVHETDSIGETVIKLLNSNLEIITTVKPNSGFFKRNLYQLDDYLVTVQSDNLIDKLCIISKKNGERMIINPELSKTYQEIKIDSVSNFQVFFSALPPFQSYFKYRYDLKNNEVKLVGKQRQLPGFDINNYKIIRRNVTVEKGVMVPVLIIAKKGIIKPLLRSKQNKLLLDVYGSYGKSNRPILSASDISLLDRNIIIAIVQVRGGSELGPTWWKEGKSLYKINTVKDFITCAQKLIKKRYSGKGLLIARGTSAGGIPVGAAINENPELFHTAIIKMGAVNPLNHLLSAETYFSRLEFGNPSTTRGVNNILKYEPYYNIKNQNYPNIILINSLNDPRVEYWQQLKYIAKLRSHNTNNSILVLKTLYGTGHFGGRYNAEINAMINTILLNDK